MIRRGDQARTETKQMFDGNGQAHLKHILNGSDEMYGKGRVFSHLTLEPGCEVGWHIHHGDGETYYILSGKGEYNDNGTTAIVGPGDITFVDSEEGHSLKNIGEENLEAIALILFK
ncbi:MAG: cupin domain-containing protein [Oscillospiraceae bacterium]|nr:cupin domain-containing protein [Oscillospiraceae bacterium]